MIVEYPSNSNHKTPPKEEKPKVEKIVVGNVVERKPGLGKRFMGTFFEGGDAKDVGRYLLWEVLMPAAKDMIADAASQGVNRMIFGDSASRRGLARTAGTAFGRVNFNQMSQGSPPPGMPTMSKGARASFDFRELVIPDRASSQLVLDSLAAQIERYGSCTVMDFYERVGVSGEFTDDKYGWFDLEGTTISRVPGGFLIDFPKPVQLDRR